MLTIRIEKEGDTDQRVDKFLKKFFHNAGLGSVYKWIRIGKIKINQKKVSETYKLHLGDTIELYFTPEELKELTERNEKKIVGNPREKELIILYEDDAILAVNKPPGLNVHPGDHKTKEVSLIELIHDKLNGKYNTLSFRPSLVHRIDRDTSGVILIAKKKKALEFLLGELQCGKMEKIYHTLVLGTPEKSRDTIQAPLLRVENAHNEAKVRVDPEGQKAITHYRVLKEKIHNKYTLLECRIETGRTHQIRVHMASIGCPVLGDHAYGNHSENSYAKKNFGINRQLLHAYSLDFSHPVSKKKIHITAPYTDDFLGILNKKII